MGSACGSPAPATTAKPGATKTTINSGKPTTTTKANTPAPAVKGAAGMTPAVAEKTLTETYEKNLVLNQEISK